MPEITPPPYESWWADGEIELVEDRTRAWTLTKYKAADGYWIVEDGYRMLGKVTPGRELPPGAVIQENAWDHEHCALCWGKISEYENDSPEGYTDGKHWICPPCYEKHILPREKQWKGVTV